MGLAGVAALAGLCLATAGCDAIANATSAPRPPETVYASTCGYCHGHNVRPIILGKNIPAETVTAFVRGGQGAMPAFRQTEISDQELKALAEWIEASKADPKEHGQ
jgi:mono/diheme cytochrome c family protein